MSYPLKNWYIIQTFVNKENLIKRKVEKLQIEDLLILLPLRKLCEKRKGVFKWVLKPLFPGYFFINKMVDMLEVKLITKIDGVIKILQNNKKIIPVPEKDMEFILSLLDTENNIPESQGFMVDDKVKITAGPLINQEGRVMAVEKRRNRITVRIPFFNTYKDVQFSIDIINKL